MRLFNPAGIVNPNLTLHCTALRYTNYNYSYNYNYATLHYTTVHQTTLHYATLHYITLRSLNYHKCNCNYTALIILHHNDNSTTLQLQLQLCYTPLHPAVVGEVTDQVTTATIATTPKKQLQPPVSPSVDSLCHPCFTTINLSYRFPILETSATALCGTTGKKWSKVIQRDIQTHQLSWAGESWWIRGEELETLHWG